jgi:superfamily II DNA or RNA helicase
LVVLATGLGKTWLAAFDSENFQRVLFVAHREEILAQAMATFRRIQPKARFGRYTGDEKDLTADALFASIQTLGRASHLRNFHPDAFDYIVVDEFHHASARTYRALIEHFTPRFLLGLTATPERTDGGDLLGLCQENLVFRCDMFEGIEQALLSPFRYFGIPDEVDYAQIPWRSSSFDEEELTAALATQARAQNAFDQLRQRGGQRAIGFCCSRVHADFMAEASMRGIYVLPPSTPARPPRQGGYRSRHYRPESLRSCLPSTS